MTSACPGLASSIPFHFTLSPSVFASFLKHPLAWLHPLQLQMLLTLPELCSLILRTFFSCSLPVLFLKLGHFLEVLAEEVKEKGESLVQSLSVFSS